jgi:hypothetical protein
VAYAVEFLPAVTEYLLALTSISVEAIETILHGTEAELGADAEKFYARDPGPAGSQHFEFETTIGDGVTQYLFRFIATMEFASQGVVRVVYVDHEILGTIEPGP